MCLIYLDATEWVLHLWERDYSSSGWKQVAGSCEQITDIRLREEINNLCLQRLLARRKPKSENLQAGCHT